MQEKSILTSERKTAKPMMWKLENEERQMLNGSSFCMCRRLGNNGPSANSKIQFSWGRSLKITWGLKAMNDCTLIFFGACHWIYSGTNANKKFSFWLLKREARKLSHGKWNHYCLFSSFCVHIITLEKRTIQYFPVCYQLWDSNQDGIFRFLMVNFSSYYFWIKVLHLQLQKFRPFF